MIYKTINGKDFMQIVLKHHTFHQCPFPSRLFSSGAFIPPPWQAHFCRLVSVLFYEMKVFIDSFVCVCVF